MRLKKLAVIFTILATFGLFATVAFAAPTVSKSNFLLGVTAVGNAQATYSGPGSWTCGVSSYTSPSTTINVIGWTWWHCDQYNSGGSLVSRYSFGGFSTSNSSAANSVGISNGPGVTSVLSNGTHDFNHTGASQYRPYNYAP